MFLKHCRVLLPVYRWCPVPDSPVNLLLSKFVVLPLSLPKGLLLFYIVDGVPLESIDGINTNDITSMEIFEGCRFCSYLRFPFGERCDYYHY